MVSRGNLITAVLVVLALPVAYLTDLLLESVGVEEQTAFALAFLVLVGIGVFLPQLLTTG
ncbi:hypothetical protein SAMN04487950_0455 [Halogranum rubrum]|uniref:Uncharacterized protein n=1 Tax=Halogranum rubrum TaxID=553466 RepID=A0A1I4BBP3_9EURY|nr:hypothetical protein [Halogranum rubrum]SFK66194.1 hypothetical protein SAMN04487950_0455 [Halogranum rubrum]